MPGEVPGLVIGTWSEASCSCAFFSLALFMRKKISTPASASTTITPMTMPTITPMLGPLEVPVLPLLLLSLLPPPVLPVLVFVG